MTPYEKEEILTFKRGAVSLCIASKTGTNISASLEIADHLAHVSERGKVLYLNTVQTDRQLGSSIREYINKDYSSVQTDPNITYLSAPPGVLDALRREIRKCLDSGVRFIIINSWEFAVKDHRRKTELICQIMDWTNIYGAAVLIFCEEQKTDPITGKIHHGSGGIGKLSVLAKRIFNIASVTENKEFIDFKTGMEIHSDDSDEDFNDLDRKHKEAASETAYEDDIDNWKPKDVAEEIVIYNAYMKNHPELVLSDKLVWGAKRDYIMYRIREEKKQKRALEKEKAAAANKATIIQTNLPDKGAISSEKLKAKSENGRGAVASEPASAGRKLKVEDPLRRTKSENGKGKIGARAVLV